MTYETGPRVAIPRQSEAAEQKVQRTGSGWYCADLHTHTHTHHSDAEGSLDDLVRAAEARGLEVLAVTDHNTVSHHRVLAQQRTPLLLIPGQELTTSRGHANVWGETGWVDFRLTRDADLLKLVEHVQNSGGLFSINHPKDTGHNWHYPIPEHFDALEVWQSAWAYRNWESVAFADSLLREGRRFTFVGGSDRHQPSWPDTNPLFLQVGTPTTWLYLTEWTVAGILAALRNGCAYLSESPVGPRLELSVAGVPMGGTLPRSPQLQLVTTRVTGAAGCTLRYLSDEGVVRTVVISDDTFTDSWWWRPDGHFLRAEVVADPAVGIQQTRLELGVVGISSDDARYDELLSLPRIRALSNPVFVTHTF